MDEARGRGQWAHTAQVLTMLANINRDKKKKSTPFKPSDFNPYDDPKQAPVPMEKDLSALKAVFIDNRPGVGQARKGRAAK